MYFLCFKRSCRRHDSYVGAKFSRDFQPLDFPSRQIKWMMSVVELFSLPKHKNPSPTRDDIPSSFQKIASIAFPLFPIMSIQHCRMTTFSSALSRIGRQSTRTNSGPTTIVSRCWNQRSMSPPVSSSIRNYAIMVDASQATMISSHAQTTTGHNFFRSLESFFGLQRSTAETAVTTNSPSSVLSWAIWLIKRTYQPSLLKKKRQCGYMKRKQTVGGRRILKRRRKKGRKRLFGA